MKPVHLNLLVFVFVLFSIACKVQKPGLEYKKPNSEPEVHKVKVFRNVYIGF